MNHILMPLILMLLLSACGKTGALYLPEQEAAAETNTNGESQVLINEGEDHGSL